ncbi:hypothetical protein O6H91_03G071500 [Diphasiastrum complanatum]|uniref:Uncharacterized protein n=1 Tax=Diphasiastrum complanatum TaxID=34168 RepID=A0ACC2E7F1_DIPCM|nr:hypothetical protein O6H91_03G071500 [Diphasiastrum complanatum]
MGWRSLLPALMRRASSKCARACSAAERRATSPGLTHDYTHISPSSNPCASGKSIFHPFSRYGCTNDHRLLKYGHQLQALQRISTFNSSLQIASDGSEQPVRSPLSQAPGPLGSAAGSVTLEAKSKVVRAVLKKINQSPKKVSLAAKLVRGMRADNALMQMTVLPKRAAKTVYKVIHSARANAIHNNGLDSARLVVAEAFVGKGVYLKRRWIHGRGKQGIRTGRTCRLTVVLKEMSPTEEAELAKTRVMRFQEQRFQKSKASKLSPHRLIQTRWNRQRNLISKRRFPSSSSRTVRESQVASGN